MKKNNKNLIILLFTLLIVIVVLYFFLDNKDTKIHNKLKKLNIDDVNNVMIVAHSDDEALWGGAHLVEEKYLVVCVTCGSNKTRKKEFISAMKKINAPYIVLNYPDLVNGKKDDWKESYQLIKSDLTEIINYKQLNKIVTHNPDGEYGHIHHIMVSEILTSISDHNNLYYFNKYYTN